MMNKKKYFICSLKVFLYLICFTVGFGIGAQASLQYRFKQACKTVPPKGLDSLKKAVVKMGDIPAYHLLKNEFRKKKHPQEYLLYSIVMADKYHYTPANYDVYYCLTSVFDANPSLGKIDKRTKGLALDYLERGVKLNDPIAKKEYAKLDSR